MIDLIKGGIALLILVAALSCSRVYHLADDQVTTYQITEKNINSNRTAPLDHLIEPYRQSLSAEMGEMVALASHSMQKAARGASESTLGNWVADAILSQTELITREEIDFAICNPGGLRVPSLPAGPITRGHFYELMPFDNYLVTMQLPGTVIRKLFDTMAASSGWPISAGVTYQIKDKKAQNINIRGAALDALKTYQIALSDYLAEGGNDCSFLKEYPYQNLNIYYRDALIEYALSKHARSQSLDARIEGRVVSLDQ